jgi:hypothetical protein
LFSNPLRRGEFVIDSCLEKKNNNTAGASLLLLLFFFSRAGRPEAREADDRAIVVTPRAKGQRDGRVGRTAGGDR